MSVLTNDPSARSVEEDVTALAAAAARWRLAQILLERPRGMRQVDVARLAGEVDSELLAAAAGDFTPRNEGAYLRLFGPGGAVSPRAAGYCGARDPAWIAADVRRLYHAFAFQSGDVEDPVDHVAVMAGFVSFLYLKEAFARATGAGAASGAPADDSCAAAGGEAAATSSAAAGAAASAHGSDPLPLATTCALARDAFCREHLAPLAHAMVARLSTLSLPDTLASVPALAALEALVGWLPAPQPEAGRAVFLDPHADQGESSCGGTCGLGDRQP